MSASQVDAATLIEQIDIVKEVSKYIQLKPKGHEYTACCPFHQEDTPSFYVNPVKRLYYCFGCQSGGNVINFRAQIAGLQFRDALLALANEHGFSIASTQSYRPLKDCLKQALQIYRNHYKKSTAAQNYLAKRGLQEDVIQDFEIGYVPDQWQILATDPTIQESDAINLGMVLEKNGRLYDRFRSRIMFPIHDHLGSVVGFGGRTIDDSKPKYLNSSDSQLYHKRNILYGLSHAIKAKSKHIILVEGYMDVVVLHQAGFKGAVATLGTAFTPEQFQLVCQYADQLTFCFDGDEAGRRAANKAFDTLLVNLRDQIACAFLFLEPNEDPDSYIQAHGSEAFKKRLNQSVGFSDYMKTIAQTDLDITRLEHKAQYLKRINELLKQMPDSITKRLIQGEHQFKTSSASPPPRKVTQPATMDSRLLEIIFEHPEVRNKHEVKIQDALYALPQVFKKALSQLKQQPAMSFAKFCHAESFTHTPINYVHTKDLALIEKELLDTLYRYQEKYIKSMIDELLQKSRTVGLTAAESKQLHDWLEAKKKLQKTSIKTS